MRLTSPHRVERLLPAKTAVSELGQFLDVIAEVGEDDARIRPSKPTALYWVPSSKALVWWSGWKPDVDGTDTPTTKQERVAAKLFETWGVWEQSGMARKQRMGADAWYGFPAVELGYRSDKFGSLQDYEHRFITAVKLYRPIGEPGPWVLRGGRLRVTARGIQG